MHFFSAGSTDTMFGSLQTPTQQGSPAFGSGSQSQTSGSSMFETSSQAPASTAFGQSSLSQASTSPFGTAATFGTSTGKEMPIHLHYHWWLVRVTLVVDWLFLPQNFGPVVSLPGGETGSETGARWGETGGKTGARWGETGGEMG